MRHLLLSPLITTDMPSSSSSYSAAFPLHSGCHKPKRLPPANPTPTCKHSPSATLDILVLILVLFSGTFLLNSCASYLVTSALLLLPPIDFAALLYDPPLPCAVAFSAALATVFLSVALCCRHRASRCGKPSCKGLKKAMEFDLQLQTEEECLKSEISKEVIDKLPWEGGTEDNPDYEPLRSEMREMAPPNGRAVLLFRAKCGCPVTKLQVWGTKRGRRHKKGLALRGV
uniref:Ribosomal protein L34e superfamily protein n=1 Tax=Kalanchoe fedtschenkoi TaxID=63787 RepID=A0A7N1A5C5_KALFE